MGNLGIMDNRKFLSVVLLLFVVAIGSLPLISAAPTISVNPTSGTVYSNYVVTGSGFSSSSEAQVYFQ
ncbi:MAG: hypothetical protein KGH64_04915 [Candidatus Micrarchaeota archaeon]|nr:hypothetical protein [Candidatus Micrarchaeota archaeon]